MKKWLSGVVSAALLTGCAFGNPDAKGFTEIFNTVWTNYEITVDNKNYPSMNFQADMIATSPQYQYIDASIKFNGDTSYVYARFDYVPEAGKSTFFSFSIEGYADFTTEMFYYELLNFETPVGTTTLIETGQEYRVINMASDSGFSMNIAGTVRSQIVDGVLPQLTNAKVIDLLVGRKAPVEDVYTFGLNIGNLVSLSFLEPFLGATPEAPRLTLTHNRSTNEAGLEVDYTVASTAYEAKIELSRIDAVTDDETTLSAAEILVYTTN